MEIKVGEYVRTKTGEIAKIEKCLGKDAGYKNQEHYETDVMVSKFNNFMIYEEDIKAHSPEIIDLIEVGDIIKVKELDGVREVIEDDFYNTDIFDNDVRAILDDTFYESYSKQIKDYKIVSVVTHEQFAGMEYKV